MCGINNDFKKTPELSSIFVYETINAYGGSREFFSDFYVTAVCPPGLLREGKNMNYYDDKKLQNALHVFIVSGIQRQKMFGAAEACCICLGEGKNFEFLSRLNEEQNFFQKIIPLSHPGWVMQYRRKKMNEYAENFVRTMRDAKQLAGK